MSKLVNQSKLAKIAGVSRQAINKAVDSGLVPHVLDGNKKKIDLLNTHVIAYIENATGQSFNPENVEIKQTGQKNTQKKPVKKEVRQSKKKENNDNIEVDLSNGDIPDYIKKLADDEILTFEDIYKMHKTEVDKLKIYEEFKYKKQKREIERGRLVDRELVERFFAKQRMIDKNYILSLEDRLSDDLANIFKNNDPTAIQEARLRINKESKKIIKYMALEIDKFIDRIGIDEDES